MNEALNETGNDNAKTEPEAKGMPGATLVDTVFDFGLLWTARGLRVAKSALEESGKALDTAAKALDRLADELMKKDEERKAA